MLDGNEKPSKPNKAESPPQLKKSRTVITTASDDAGPTTPIFPGPLFPAVRRISTAVASRQWPPPDRRASNAPADHRDFSDRDWVFPSFVVPQNTSKRGKKLASSDSRTAAAHGKLVDASHRIASQSPPAASVPKPEAERKKLKVVPSGAPASSSSELTRLSSRWPGELKRHLLLVVLTFTCILSVTYVFYLRQRVAQLEEWCTEKDIDSNSSFTLFLAEKNPFFFHFANAERRTVALYAVVIILTMPFVLYKHLDYLSQIRNLSKRMKSNKEEVPIKKRIAYMVDVCFSVYPYAKLLALLFATIFLIGFGGLALYAVNKNSFAEALWLSWTFVADSGNHADTEGLGPRIVSVSISSGGMLIFAMMLGLVSDAISEKVDSLRKGKSEVIEMNHILILGWSDKLGSLLKQLAIANKSVGGGVVVILAERDKEEMELDIAKLEFDFMGTSVICRSGSPLILADLKKVSVSKARAIIVLASDENADQIWEDILGFENAEFYIKRWPQLDGLRFENVLISFPDAIPCGIKVAADGGKIILNPDDNYVLKEGDEVLVIAEDDDTYSPCSFPEVCAGSCPKTVEPPKYPEKILFCGWRRDIDDMIMVLEAFLPPGSELWLFNEVPVIERDRKLTDGGLDVSRLENIKLVHKEGNAVIKRHLESLPLETFDSILILADESLEDSVVHSDSRSLATLLLIRDIQSKRLPNKDTKTTSLRLSAFSHSSWIREMQQASDKSIIISEILDSRTRNLVSVSRISDYVLSNELVSMALAMVAEDKQINRVLEELFFEQGNEMCIKPAELYLYDQEELCFYDIMLRGRQRQEIVIGYRLANTERAIINPSPKSERRKWSHDDVFVVISISE
ncbi:ion channel DMI1 isoform X3 [Prunus dulcis]|uniref:ion channel DMI1 isoform X3 n=1 Tax=Prunus dulcis TaxID=3755 RepID=UPI001481EC94|nr:ion channel DMI1 isoform X3 [Prunus dulcis]